MFIYLNATGANWIIYYISNIEINKESFYLSCNFTDPMREHGVFSHSLAEMQMWTRYYNWCPTTFSDVLPTEQIGPASVHKCAYSNCSII